MQTSLVRQIDAIQRARRILETSTDPLVLQTIAELNDAANTIASLRMYALSIQKAKECSGAVDNEAQLAKQFFDLIIVGL